MWNLQCCAMNQITDYEQGTHLISGMARCMADSITSDDVSGQGFTELKQMQPVLIGIHGFHHLSLLVVRHLHPAIIFFLRSVNLRVGENDTVSLHHAPDMVAMEMGKVEIVDILRSNAQTFQAFLQLPGRRSQSGIEKNLEAVGLYQEDTDR